MLPARNQKDFEDIPQTARDQMEFIWLERVDQAIEAALEAAVAKREAEDAPRQLIDADG
jgi:ATP-dependent Lon protease